MPTSLLFEFDLKKVVFESLLAGNSFLGVNCQTSSNQMHKLSIPYPLLQCPYSLYQPAIFDVPLRMLMAESPILPQISLQPFLAILSHPAREPANQLIYQADMVDVVVDGEEQVTGN